MKQYTKHLMLSYLMAITTAEWLLTYVDVVYGLLLHSAVFITTVLIYWRNWSKFTLNGSMVLLSFSYVSLSRLVSVSILGEIQDVIPVIVFTNAPLLICLFGCIRSVGISLMDFFPSWRYLPRELIIALTGIIFGLTERHIIDVTVIPWTGLPSFIFSAITITLLTGLYEELLFRGIVFKYLADVGSKWFAVFYSSLLFAVMHIAWESFIDIVFVFTVGAIYALIYYRTKSLAGIILSHGITNIILFMP
ncbi:MAG: CPBP family intramembrane glutamic endopeptidase [Candidatus Altiarchaeota archaeon]